LVHEPREITQAQWLERLSRGHGTHLTKDQGHDCTDAVVTPATHGHFTPAQLELIY
jgi:hypothetical protein